MTDGTWLLALAFSVAALWWFAQESVAAQAPTTPIVPPDQPGIDDMASHAYAPPIRDLALAIAGAEGFGLKDAIPTRANNPGDLVCPWLNLPTLGRENITVFPTPADGWNALYHQLQLIADGQSANFTSGMTLRELAGAWTRTEQDAWAANVAAWYQNHGYTSVQSDTYLSELLY